MSGDRAAPEFPEKEIRRHLREVARLYADHYHALNRLFPGRFPEYFGAHRPAWRVELGDATVEFRVTGRFVLTPEQRAENERRLDEYERRLAGETDDDPQAP